MFGVFGGNPYFCRDFSNNLNGMSINHYIISVAAVLLMATQVSAQEPHCKDTVEHSRLMQAMWESCLQDSQQVVYDACLAFRQHAMADNNMLEASTSWVCGIMYSLGKMNISSAYHIVQGLKGDIESSQFAEEGRYFVSNMMGHVYNTCGNIPWPLSISPWRMYT